MTTSESEIETLKAMGMDLSGALHSDFEPGCVALVFSRFGDRQAGFTMQRWIDLSAVLSPLLSTGVLESDADLLAAADIFEMDVKDATDEDKALCALGMERMVREGFAMALKMTQPDAVEGRGDEGFGAWLPMYAFLIRCGFSDAEARGYEVGQAFALMAATRSNEGWNVAGVKYALRDVASEMGDRSSEIGGEQPEGVNRD